MCPPRASARHSENFFCGTAIRFAHILDETLNPEENDCQTRTVCAIAQDHESRGAGRAGAFEQ
jgi:hypothetical protein